MTYLIARVGLLALVLLASALAFADGAVANPVAAGAVIEDPLDRQVLDIGAELRCTVCQNQPISESNADLARDMRAVIREQLQAGKSKPEIMDYFVTRYGDYVLLKPPGKGAGLVVWALPAVVFAVLAISATIFLRRRSRASRPAPVLSDDDVARVARARNDERQA